jgi:hypothetical protein
MRWRNAIEEKRKEKGGERIMSSDQGDRCDVVRRNF